MTAAMRWVIFRGALVAFWLSGLEDSTLLVEPDDGWIAAYLAEVLDGGDS
jgi:hypothetical protein